MAVAAAGAVAHAEQGHVRLRATVVLDASMSMSDQDPGQLAVVAARLLEDLATPQDEVSLVEFGTTARQLGREVMTDDAAVERMHAALATSARDEWCTDYRTGLQTALDALGSAPHPGERRLVIFLTDGLFDPDRSNEGYYTTDEGRAQLAKLLGRGREEFVARPCARTYNRLVPHVEPGFLAQMETLIQSYSRSGVRLYTIGLGSDLHSASPEAARSRALLERLAAATGGAFLAATSGDQLPSFFASIYSALVGAPVEPPLAVPPERDRLGFEVLRGAKRVAVVVDAATDRDLALELSAPGGVPPHVMVRPFNVDTPQADGYRVLSLDAPPPGHYEVRRVRGQAPLKVQLIQEVGLTLAIEGLAPGSTVPEGTAPRLTLALRTSAGDPVHLSREFLSNIDVTFTRELQPEGAPAPEVATQSLRLDERAEASVELPPLRPGRVAVRARASHRLGLLNVPDVEVSASVIHQIALAFEGARLTFDVMAEEGQDLAQGAQIRLAEGSSLPIEQEFAVDWSGVSSIGDLVHGPEKIVLGPSRASAPVELRLKAPRSMRRARREFAGPVTLTAAHPELFRGEPRWACLVVDGRLRPWDWRRWYQEYALYVWSVIAATLLLLWIVGRLVASKWSKRARLHYVDLEDPRRDETSFVLARKSRSHLPFRSDRHRCGRGGTPGKNGKRRYCDVVASGRDGFRVVPLDVGVGVTRDGEVVATRKAFAGEWDARYRLGERYEIWLTRS
jgi:hypothetical protein